MADDEQTRSTHDDATPSPWSSPFDANPTVGGPAPSAGNDYFTQPIASAPTPPSPNPYAPPPAQPQPQPAYQGDPRFGTPPLQPQPVQAQPVYQGDPRFGTPAAGPAASYPSMPPPPGAGYPPPTYQPGGPVGWPGAPGYPPVGPVRFQSVSGLGTATLVLGALLVVSSVLRALTAPAAAHEYTAYIQGQFTSDSAYRAHSVVCLLQIVALPLWIVASLWLYRARENAVIIAPLGQRRSPAWCWLGWVVPIVVYWFPKQIIDDTWRATGSGAANPKARSRSTALLWGLWLTYTITYGLLHLHGYSTGGTLQSVSQQQAVQNFQVHPVLEFILAIAGIAAFIAWVPVVRGITAAQEELRARAYGSPVGGGNVTQF